MKGSSQTTPAPARTRRWRVPPPLTRGGELLEGAEILREISGETAVLLWKSLRSTTLWATATPREQADLFSEGARQKRLAELLLTEVDEPLREPLEIFAELLGSPGRIRRETVALACRSVARWAAERGADGTALAFTQAAALVCPGDAEAAFHVGRLARHQMQHARAESWYRRAIMIGRQTRSWEAYARAYLGLGSLAMQRGSLPLARRCHIKALRSARRHGLREIQAYALHDLFVVSMEYNDSTAAVRYAERAFRLYGPDHRHVPLLAHDLCCLWISEGKFARAVPVLRALLPHLKREVRLLALANLARAAGGTGDRESFEAAWQQALSLLDPLLGRRHAAQSMLNLARGAAGVGEWERAREMAERALAAAGENGEANIVFEAESVLGFARNHQAAECVEVSGSPEQERATDEFAEELAEALTAGAA